MTGLREAVMDKLCELADKGENFNILVSDSTSTSKIESFIKKYPDRVVNVGIAEQNLVGMAAGMALGGITAITANAAPFLVARSNEQVKNDICYTDSNVKLIGLNPGCAYGALGPTHHAIDDISIMRSLGNIRIFAPADAAEAKAITEYAVLTKGPMYIRLDSISTEDIHDDKYLFVPGNINIHSAEGDIAVIALGTAIHDVIAAAAILKEEGITLKIIGLPSIRPLDKITLTAELASSKGIITVEEHSTHGGLGSLVSDLMMENAVYKPLIKLGIPEGSFAPADPRNAIKRKMSIDPEGIAKTARIMENRCKNER
jgi:transketolase